MKPDKEKVCTTLLDVLRDTGDLIDQSYKLVRSTQISEKNRITALQRVQSYRECLAEARRIFDHDLDHALKILNDPQQMFLSGTKIISIFRMIEEDSTKLCEELHTNVVLTEENYCGLVN